MNYMSLFPSASRELPRFSALAEAILSQVNDLMAVIAALPAAFSVSGAVGEQLDALGSSMMLPRSATSIVATPHSGDRSFRLTSAPSEFPPLAADGASPSGLTDAEYREYLAAKLALFTWDGSNDSAQEILARLFPGSTICDNCDGTVTVHPASTLQAEHGLFPVPAGVRAIVS